MNTKAYSYLMFLWSAIYVPQQAGNCTMILDRTNQLYDVALITSLNYESETLSLV